MFLSWVLNAESYMYIQEQKLSQAVAIPGVPHLFVVLFLKVDQLEPMTANPCQIVFIFFCRILSNLKNLLEIYTPNKLVN